MKKIVDFFKTAGKDFYINLILTLLVGALFICSFTSYAKLNLNMYGYDFSIDQSSMKFVESTFGSHAGDSVNDIEYQLQTFVQNNFTQEMLQKIPPKKLFKKFSEINFVKMVVTIESTEAEGNYLWVFNTLWGLLALATMVAAGLFLCFGIYSLFRKDRKFFGKNKMLIITFMTALAFMLLLTYSGFTPGGGLIAYLVLSAAGIALLSFFNRKFATEKEKVQATASTSSSASSSRTGVYSSITQPKSESAPVEPAAPAAGTKCVFCPLKRIITIGLLILFAFCISGSFLMQKVTVTRTSYDYSNPSSPSEIKEETGIFTGVGIHNIWTITNKNENLPEDMANFEQFLQMISSMTNTEIREYLRLTNSFAELVMTQEFQSGGLVAAGIILEVIYLAVMGFVFTLLIKNLYNLIINKPSVIKCGKWISIVIFSAATAMLAASIVFCIVYFNKFSLSYEDKQTFIPGLGLMFAELAAIALFVFAFINKSFKKRTKQEEIPSQVGANEERIPLTGIRNDGNTSSSSSYYSASPASAQRDDYTTNEQRTRPARPARPVRHPRPERATRERPPRRY